MLARALQRLASSILAHRRLYIIGLLLLSLVAGVVGTRLRADFSVQELFSSGDPEIGYLERFHRRFGPDDDTLLLLLQADDVFRPDVLRLVQRITERSRQMSQYFTRVDSLTTASDLGRPSAGTVDKRPLLAPIPPAGPELRARKRRALRSPLLTGRLVSRDARLTVVALKLQPGLRKATDLERVSSAMEALLRELPRLPGVQLRLAGVPYVRTEAVRLVQNDQLRFLPLGMAVTTLLLVLLYRGVARVLVPMLCVGLSAAYTVSLMAALDAPIDILSNVLPLLVMVYGVADAVHLMTRVDEERRAGASPNDAIRLGVRHLGLACLLTSATTAIGFISLLAGSMRILHRFGLFAAAGVMLAYVTTMVVAPLGMSLRRPRPVAAEHVPLPGLERLLTAIGRLAVARPLLLLCCGITIGAAALALGTRVEVNNYLLGVYRRGHPTEQATRLVEQKLSGVVRLQVSLEGAKGVMKRPAVLRAMHRLERWLQRQPEVSGTLSLATVVRQTHRAVVGQAVVPDNPAAVAELLLLAEGTPLLERLVDYPYSAARVVVGARDIGARRFLPFVARVQRQASRAFSGLPLRVHATGTSLVAYRGINRMVLDLLSSLSVAFVVIALVLALVFRSLALGLISLIPNLMPLAAGLGFMALAGIRLEPATVIVYSIALGIAVDDTIHFFARYREEVRGGLGVERAVQRTLNTTGRAMVFSSLVLVSGFSVTLFSNFRGTADFGVVGMVILATALLADLLVTPACLLVFRPWGRGRPRGSAGQ